MKWEQTYFTWHFSGEVAVGGEFETAGVLGGGVYNVNVARLPTDRKTDVTSEGVLTQISFLSYLIFAPMSTESQRRVLLLPVK